MAKRKPTAETKRKRVTISPIQRTASETAYKILDFLIGEYHTDLADAKIMLAYQMSDLREDVDGMVGFGRVKRGNDLDRAYAQYDFVLIIPHAVWQGSDETPRHAILDWMLCHCAITKDKHGDPALDEEDRLVYRLRRPIKVFSENVRRYGLWQSEPVEDAIKSYRDKDRPLLSQMEGAKPAAPKKKAPAKEKAPAKAETNGHHQAVGALSTIALPFEIVQACEKADLKTVDAVQRYHGEHGVEGLASLKGMGSERAEKLWATIEKHQAEPAAAGK